MFGYFLLLTKHYFDVGQLIQNAKLVLFKIICNFALFFKGRKQIVLYVVFVDVDKSYDYKLNIYESKNTSNAVRFN